MRNGMTPAVSSEWMEWAQKKCDELMPRYFPGRLPFVEFDNDGNVLSSWNVTDSGDPLDDLARGVVFAELLVHHAKTFRESGSPKGDPMLLILETLMAIARKGNPGWVERGFLGRFAILAMVASLN
jgi:hypothetical protein